MATEPALLDGKSDYAIRLYRHFMREYQKLGKITAEPTQSMIGISNGRKKIAWVTQVGRNFIHVVFPFEKPFSDNLCFQKIAQVPGDANQFNHHFRMLSEEDLNEEVIRFMRKAMAD